MWKDIPGYEGLYAVNENGDVKSLKRIITNSNGVQYPLHERILKHNVIKNGYHVVDLMKDHIRQPYYVHRLVGDAFIDNPEKLPTINHKDGNKSNCSVDNLEWCTYGYNNQHSYDTGLHGRGDKHYRSILTEQDVKEIRALGKYATYDEIGDKYGVSKATIRDVLENKTWKHIK